MFLPLLAMHIPDGFLSLPVSIAGWVLAILLVGFALRQIRHHFEDHKTPLMGIIAAFIFAAQMINFPVAGGTSGHLIGGTLVAILLGPWAAALVMTSVVTVQALVFQDGGLLALGFNLINMAIISPFVGYAIYTWIRGLLRDRDRGPLIAAASGAWLSVVLAAGAAALELAASGTIELGIALPAMAGVHVLIGIGEALITVGALAFIRQTRPDLLAQKAKPLRGTRWVGVGLLITLCVVLLSPLASPEPDGLERVAEDQGFIQTAQDSPYQLMPGYHFPAVDNEALATILSGGFGVLVVAGVGYVVGRQHKKGESTN